MPLSNFNPDLIAFIDESGDEGFNYSPPPNKRGNEWFVLAAILSRISDRADIRRDYDEFKATYDRQPSWRFHFKNDRHETRLGFIRHMTTQPVTCMSVIVHKPSLTNLDAFTMPYRLYFYAAKFLIERISWRAAKLLDHETAHGGVRLVFSTRRGLNRAKVNEYLSALHSWAAIAADFDAAITDNSIDWRTINLAQTIVYPNEKSIGLQYADAAASGIAKAIEYNKFGMTEHRYLKMLKPVLYKSGGSYFSYGLKFFPTMPASVKEQPRFAWVKYFQK